MSSNADRERVLGGAVTGGIDGDDLDPVAAWRHVPAVDLAPPVDMAQPAANLQRTHALDPVHEQERAGALVEPIGHDQPPAAVVPATREHTWLRREEPKTGPRHVHAHRVQEAERSVGVGEMHARPVDGLRDEPASVVAAVPLQHEPAGGDALFAGERPYDVAVVVHDLDGETVGLPEPEGELRLRGRAVANR